MKARVKVDLERTIGQINKNIYGQFMCRRPGVSEGGLYAPESPSADEYGLRREVVTAMEELKPPLIRWPGGCTGTSYHWLDGVGPIEDRPRNIDLHFGWEARYEFGTHEFISFCRRIGAEPHLNLAMGTGTLDEAAAWVEYCNSTLDTTYANLRRKHGQAEPYNVKYWQLGNEMYGPWEIGHCKAAEYGAEAREWAKVLRRLDPSISMIAVGGGDWIAADWAREVVPQVGPYVDYISFHTYWHEAAGQDPWYTTLAGPHIAEQTIDELSAVIRTVRRRNRQCRNLGIAITEWNASPAGTMMSNHPVFNPFGPTYHLRDALAVASFINIMQRHCNEVTLATVAQSINVVGLIMVNGEDVWREPVYWPLWMQVRHSGSIALDALVEGDTFDEPLHLQTEPSPFLPQRRPLTGLSYLDCSTTFDPDRRKLYLSLVNRHRDEAISVAVEIPEAAVASEGSVHTLYHDDPMAMNTPADPDNVKPSSERTGGFGSRFARELEPHSYTILELDLE